MSTLVAQTISNGTVSTSSANVIQGSAKAWVNFNGYTTTTIRASYNVSSVTYNATGDYTINFTNAFSDVNYSYVASTGQADSGDPSASSIGLRMSPFPGNPSTTYTMTTSAIRLQARYQNSTVGGVQDSQVVCFSAFR
jgi:hypothetical protein